MYVKESSIHFKLNKLIEFNTKCHVQCFIQIANNDIQFEVTK